MIFQNIQGYTDQQIRRLGNALLTSALLTQKYSDRPEMLVDRFNQIFSILGSWTDRNLFRSLIVYFIELIEIEGEELEIMIQKIPDVMKTEFVSLADRLRESGRKEGRAEGRKEGRTEGRSEGIHEKNRIATKNMLRKGFDVSTICDILEVTPEFVEKVRKSMKL